MKKKSVGGKILFFDCRSGISGDMILGALIDLDVPLAILNEAVKSLGLGSIVLSKKNVKRSGISGVKLCLSTKNIKPKIKEKARTLPDIEKMINQAELSSYVKENSIAIFLSLAKVEAKVHRTTVDRIHFHEVGAVDSIIDIVGSVVALEFINPDSVLGSAINTGEGQVVCEHGVLPVPAPATLELLKNIPNYSDGTKMELATPTGVAIIKHFAQQFSSQPLLVTNQIGYGAGDHIIPEKPNLLRVIRGEGDRSQHSDKVWMIDTNIDDMNPEFYDHVIDLLFKNGALDVHITPILMKKNRPAVKLSVMSKVDDRDDLAKTILEETTSIGVRMWETERITLNRTIKKIKTVYGDVKVKLIEGRGESRFSPEYDDIKKIASQKKLPIDEVYNSVMKIAIEKLI